MMRFDLIIVDLDNTLYRADTGVFARMDERMTAFIAERLGVDRESADALRVKYWRQYGSTLRGLMLHHDIEPEAFLKEAHDIDADKLLAPDPMLDQALRRLSGRKVIHTNAIREHAERILRALAVEHHFAGIYDIRFNGYVPKPCARTLAMLIEAEGASPERTLVIDDMAENLAAAQCLGCKTVWISKGRDGGEWDYQAPSLQMLAERLA